MLRHLVKPLPQGHTCISAASHGGPVDSDRATDSLESVTESTATSVASGCLGESHGYPGSLHCHSSRTKLVVVSTNKGHGLHPIVWVLVFNTVTATPKGTAYPRPRTTAQNHGGLGALARRRRNAGPQAPPAAHRTATSGPRRSRLCCS